MPSRKLFVYGLVFALTGGLMAAALTASFFVEKHDPHALPPTDRGLDSALFVRTSAEYRACCYQAYSLAEERVSAKLANLRLEDKPPRVGKRMSDDKPPAVVLDLDETVIDNGGFQARQVRARQATYSKADWDRWEKDDGGEVGFVPGAKEFLAYLKAKKVEAVYITNRNEKHRKELHALLKRLEIDVPDEQLLLNKDDVSDKTARRSSASERFDVLLWVGDNLRDFDNVFKYDDKKGADGRKAAVDERRAKFGSDWIIIPNPVYGEWMKGFKLTGADADLLK